MVLLNARECIHPYHRRYIDVCVSNPVSLVQAGGAHFSKRPKGHTGHDHIHLREITVEFGISKAVYWEHASIAGVYREFWEYVSPELTVDKCELRCGVGLNGRGL